MGHNWLKHIGLNWREIGVAMLDTTQSRLKSLLQKYGDVFKDELGTINSIGALDTDQHPLPRPEDLFATVTNGKVFLKLDLLQAYQQMLLASGSEKYLTINTHLSLYQYTRLPFGVASAPALFQRAMDIITQGITGVICYIDDILISGESDEQHLDRVEEVLKRLAEHGLRVKQKKCEFLKPSVEYLRASD